jgi:chromatin remodeling complex protein RSC6
MPKVKRSRPVRKSRKEGVAPPVPVENVEEKVAEDVVEVVEDVVEDVAEVPIEDDAMSVSTTSSRRRKYTREDVERACDGYLDRLSEQLELTRQDKNRKVRVKDWNDLLKEARKLKSIVVRATKKTKNSSKGNSSSGFMKPVNISSQMAKFTGWNVEEPHSRLDVTRFICQYIKENNLQDENDGRKIIPDKKLKKLLDYHPSKEEPLTYCYLQKKVQPHFVKV